VPGAVQCPRAHGAILCFALLDAFEVKMLAPESTLHDRYRITYVVEERPDGVIYRAIDTRDSLRVLIAELPQPGDGAVDDVAHLAAQIAGVTAPGLLTLRAHFASGLTYYLVADDPGGQDLERVARDRGGPLPEVEVLGLVERLLGALDVLHSRTPPLLVGDLRSTDMWSSLDGGLFLAPFALARHFAKDDSPYRAPELSDADAEPTTASDVYAIGAVLYQLLTGWAPPTVAQRMAGTPLNSPRVLNARVSALAEQLVLRALELKPVNRYQQAREMRSALETVRLMAGRPLGATAPVEAAQYGASQTIGPQGVTPQPAAPLPPRPVPPAGEPAGYGPPPPAPPPGWTGGSPAAGAYPPPGAAPYGAAQGAPAGWQTVPPAAAPPAQRRGVSNGCLIALVALLAVLALGICVVGAWLGWLIMQNAGTLPLLPGASAMATAPPTSGAATQGDAPAAGQSSGQPAASAGESLRQAATFTETQQIEGAAVGAVLYAPDGKTIAVGLGGDIQLRDAESLDSGPILSGHQGDISALAFSPDGSILASGAQDDNVIRVWDVAAGRELRQLEGHTGWIRSLAFSPDGSILASGSTDRTVILWDAESGRQLRTLEGHADFLGNIAFSPDGASLASASRDGTVRVWDVAAGRERDDFAYTAPLNPDDSAPFWLTGVSWSPDGDTLAVGSISGSVYILDAATGRQQRELQGHDGWVVIRGVSFSPDGDLLASASLDGTVHLWSPRTGTDRGTLQQRGLRLLGLAWSPDGARLATSSDTAGNVAVWDVSSQEVVRTALLAQGAVTTLAYSDSGQLLGTGGANGSVRVHVLGDNREVPLSGGAPTNQYLAFLSDTQLVAVSDAGDVVVIGLAGGSDVKQLEGLDGFALSVAVSRDRRLLAAGNERGDVTLWDASTLEEVRTLRGLGGPVYAIAFNADASELAAVTNEPAERPKVIVWDVASGDARTTFSGHGGPITAIDMPAGHDWVASASGDRTLKIWDAASGDEVRSIEAQAEQGWYSGLAFSPDGAVLVTGTLSGEVEFWDTATGERIGGLPLAGGTILALAYSPDGSQVAVATRDAGVYLLEPQG
jgi:WD40 repeat protein